LKKNGKIKSRIISVDEVIWWVLMLDSYMSS
jgi:hypothetical protein